MLKPHPFRALATHPASLALLLLGVLSTRLQAQLPNSGPAKPSAAFPSAQPAASATPQQSLRPPHHSQVTLDHGLLTVIAANASLNGLIHEIARQTGMKVTGSVAEDRVFGTYGPDDPQHVLATLLDGTGSNILIRSSAADAPLQLILTPRTGVATPPNPNANLAGNDDDDEATPPPGAPTAISAPRARPASIPASVPTPAQATGGISPASSTLVFPAPDGTSAPPAATTTPAETNTPADASPDAVKTPQQIFDQLQKLRQQSTGATTPQ